MKGGVELGGRVSIAGFSLTAHLTVGAGEVVAVRGPNGAGKSTLLRCLAGLQPLASGRLLFAGDLWDEPGHTFVPPWQRRVGLLFQDLRLLPHLSALDNVSYALHRLGRHRAREVALEWLDRTGVVEVARRRPAQLSGGEAQRVALARLLASDPRLILLDEPTASVDAATKPVLRQLLATTLAEAKVPVVVVTHDQAEADQLAHRHVHLAEGRLG